MTTGLRHAAHPLQLGAIQIVGTGYLGSSGVDALLPFLQIVSVIATIGIEGMTVELDDDGAHTVEEESVVGHHEQRPVASGQIALQPLYHLQVEMVGGLVEYQQVGLHQQHVGQRHSLLLTATQLSHRLLQIANLQLRQHLLGLQQFLLLVLMIEAGFEHRLRRVEAGRLLQIADGQVAAEHDAAPVARLLASQHRQQRRLARAVASYQPHPLPLGNAEADVAEQPERAERFRHALHVNVWGILSHSILGLSARCSQAPRHGPAVSQRR